MNDMHALLHRCLECPPEEATVCLHVFADWLEEHGDARCGEIRRILHRGPVEVEATVQEPGLSHPALEGVTAAYRKIGHVQNYSGNGYYWICGCGGSQFRFLLASDEARPLYTRCFAEWKVWRDVIDGKRRDTLFAHGKCEKCGRGSWMYHVDGGQPYRIAEWDSRREFLHRMRVECLQHFFLEADFLAEMTVDGRWPAVVTPISPEERWVAATNNTATRMLLASAFEKARDMGWSNTTSAWLMSTVGDPNSFDAAT